MVFRAALPAIAIALSLMAACGGGAAAPASSEERAEVSRAEPSGPFELGGSFKSSASMIDARQDHQAVLLPAGRVMAIAGLTKAGSNWGASRLVSVTVYDPASSEFTPTGSLATGRQHLTAHTLEDGRVFVVGGRGLYDAIKTTEIWDPATEVWGKGPRMASERFQHDSVVLQDGRILVVGGQNKLFALLLGAELFDPMTEEMSPAGAMSIGRSAHSATLLQDGRVLVVGGGEGGEGSQEETFDSTDIYDPETGEWSPAGTMSAGHADHTTTLLNDGRVLVTGGRGKVTAVDLFDPVTDTWSVGASFTEWRAQHSATLLGSGIVLVTGGVGRGATTESYDPASGTWSRGPEMTLPRYAHTATLLNDGSVFLLGGQSIDATGSRREVSNESEVYTP